VLSPDLYEKASTFDAEYVTSLSDLLGGVDESWRPIDLASVLSGTLDQPKPELLVRTDGRCLLYRGTVNGVHGDSGVGKSWLAVRAIADIVSTGGRVLVLDFEDVAPSFVARLLFAGLSVDQIAQRVDYRRPSTPLDPLTLSMLLEDIKAREYDLVVVDSLGEVFGLHGINEDKDAEVGPWLRRYARAIAEAGPAVFLVDHATKAADNPLHPSGSKRKRAAIGGASYLVEAVTPFVKGTDGRLKVTCAKDRHGNYRRSEVVAYLVMSAAATPGSPLTLVAPEDGNDAPAHPVVMAARQVVEVVRTSPVALSKTAARKLVTLRTSTDNKRAAIDYALDKGAVRSQTGYRNAQLLIYVHPLDEAPT